ncbi:hypothetical protein [truncated ORF], partial [Aspergillus niger]|uniref:Uncharacterized protein n=2 Tax=Aspergillus niger TaxID=5061 RepID=A0AAJ8E1T3_ASPNG
FLDHLFYTDINILAIFLFREACFGGGFKTGSSFLDIEAFGRNSGSSSGSGSGSSSGSGSDSTFN